MTKPKKRTASHIFPPESQTEKTHRTPPLPHFDAIALATFQKKFRGKSPGEITTQMRSEYTQKLFAAATAQADARAELCHIAKGLLPKAKELAERGRPRLLAVLTKIILDKNLRLEAPNEKLLPRAPGPTPVYARPDQRRPT